MPCWFTNLRLFPEQQAVQFRLREVRGPVAIEPDEDVATSQVGECEQVTVTRFLDVVNTRQLTPHSLVRGHARLEHGNTPTAIINYYHNVR